MFKDITNILGVLVFTFALHGAGASAGHIKTPQADVIALHSRAVLSGDVSGYQNALSFFEQRGQLDIVPSMIIALRFHQGAGDQINATLKRMTGGKANSWFEWVEWQQDHPEIKPHTSYLPFKLDIFDRIDPRYRVFFRTGYDQPDDMRVRVEEMVWGGPRAMTGIPSLNHPKMITAQNAEYILDDDLVFGIKINDDIRAYPLRIMGWHEMFNDVIGGVPVALAYCTLCGSGILFETDYAGRTKPFVFGSSGMLYRSNKLMFDWESYSLWNQFTGEPVAGPLAKSGIKLKTRPVVIMTWKDWRSTHPKTKILSLDTGYPRDYSSGAVYREYFASPDLMFPVSANPSPTFKKKDYIFGIRQFGAAKAWPLTAFAHQSVINDHIAERNIVLIGDSKTRTVRAYERGKNEFTSPAAAELRSTSGVLWTISEAALRGPDGQQLPRIAGVLSYWFAWDGYMGLESAYYTAKP